MLSILMMTKQIFIFDKEKTTLIDTEFVPINESMFKCLMSMNFQYKVFQFNQVILQHGMLLS